MTASTVASNDLRVLVVDDDIDHRVLIGRRLRERGHTVIGAASGNDARQVLASDSVDVVLLDYRLPDVEGLDLLTELRDPTGPAIVLVTGMGSESVAVEALRAGATDYIAKDQRYLEDLPLTVERAWRHHDHARRAARLQRLALLVHSASDRSHILSEVVKGAQALLRARSCALLVLTADTLEVAAREGAEIEDLHEVLATARAGLDGDAPQSWSDDEGRLYVPLPATLGDPVGTLLVVPARPLCPEDRSLVEAFASFAGTAIVNSNRLELERELVSHLQRVVDARREFLAAVSHELRTPLTCIQGFSSTLLNRDAELDPTERRQFAELIAQHSEELRDLVEDLLEVATLQTGRAVTELQPLDLADALIEAVDAVRPLIGDRRVAVDIPSVKVVADSRLLRRTMSNLLSNAAKYSDAGKPIRVGCAVDQTTARVAVVDEGKGLEAHELAQVFEPFWRSESALKAAARGTGVGLTLVREYVRAMGGQVEAESAPGKGSTFSFTLPLHQGAAGSPG